MEKLGIRLIRFSSSTNFSHRSSNRTYTRGNSSLRMFILPLSLSPSLRMNSHSVCYTRWGKKEKKKKKKRVEAESGIIEGRGGRGKVWSVVAPRRKKTMEKKSRWRWVDEKGGRGFDRGTQERNERTSRVNEGAGVENWPLWQSGSMPPRHVCARKRAHVCVHTCACTRTCASWCRDAWRMRLIPRFLATMGKGRKEKRNLAHPRRAK